MIITFKFSNFLSSIIPQPIINQKALGRIIAIANQKGGVGKTTTAVNIAASLAVAEQQVLLVDMDPQGNAGSGLNVKVGTHTPCIYEVLLGSATADAAIQRFENLSYLSILPSHIRLVGAQVELVDDPMREYKLKNALKGTRDKYDYLIIDCPPSLGLLTINSLTAADSVIIPIQCEYYALEGLGQLLTTLRLVQRELNPSLTVGGVVLTMFDRRLNLSRQVADEARSYFGNKIFKTIVHRNVRLSEAPSFGKPILLYDVNSTGARSYLALAKEIMNGEKASIRSRA